MKQYVDYKNITKEILDTVKVGDLIKCNDWESPMRVVGVSENYFVMIQKLFGKEYYSVCEKKPANYARNSYEKGDFRAAPDSWLFGWKAEGYRWDDPNWVKEYLKSFESGETQLSERSAIGIRKISIKSV